MRIKCPNSDIILELPGDRMDMKFTCPACHKVHRVTITITTPGEGPPPSSNTRSMPRNQPSIPKKYATGAYTPVVDIPIDANFVLLDEKSMPGKGVDLGKATEQPLPFADLSDRKTEIIDRTMAEKKVAAAPARDQPAAPETMKNEPKQKSPAWEQPVSPTAAEFAAAAAGQPDEQPVPPPAPEPDADTADTVTDNAWSTIDNTQPESPTPPAGGTASPPPDPTATWQDDDPQPRQRRGAGTVIAYGLLLVLLAAAGYLGYNEYRSRAALKEADSLLSRADSAWHRGDIATAAGSAREAEFALARSEDFYTPVQVYNFAAERTGLYKLYEPAAVRERARVAAHLEREAALNDFRSRLDVTDPQKLWSMQAEAAKADDPSLGLAMERTVQSVVMDYLRRQEAAIQPEQLLALAADTKNALSHGFSPAARSEFASVLSAFTATQVDRLAEDVQHELAAIGRDANNGQSSALPRYQTLSDRLAGLGHGSLARPLPEQANEQFRETLWQLSRLDAYVTLARRTARSVLARSEDESNPIEAIEAKATADTSPNPAMAKEAVRLIDDTVAEADDLTRLRAEVFGRVQSEMRRNRTYAGTRLAWSMLRTGFDDPEVQIDPTAFRFDTTKARMEFTYHGIPAVMEMGESDYEKQVRINIGGYTFASGWAMLFHKPLVWATELSTAMANAGVSPSLYPHWELLEGPGAPLALLVPAEDIASIGSGKALAQIVADSPAERMVFFENMLLPLSEMRATDDSRQVVDDFHQAAKRLHDGIMNDSSINQQLRQALKPVLEGTFQKPDPQDYFDSAFCRRLIEADYLKTYIIPMPVRRQAELTEYRDALGKLEAGYDEFFVALPDGRRLYAVSRLEADLAGDGVASDQDPDSGEAIPRYTWRVEEADTTVFFSPLPSRFVYAFMLAEHYPGIVKTKPAGVPTLTEVWHATKGRIAGYRNGASRAEGDDALWSQAMREDSSGRFDPTVGTPGWNYPLHVIERDDQGDPVTLATLSGTVTSPDFSNIPNEFARRKAEDAWLDATAKTLSTPGELGLIFHQFFRYCSDSPLPELPNLIGSHYGLSDTHQTVYQTLERRWVGRLIGDCDDLAEFFQVLTKRQGKLSHVMQLPGHAACGYVEQTNDEQYRFVLLQTGPVMQFIAPTLNDVVEIAYRAFDREGGISHMTMDAVPLLLRFANEETRTPFVLSSRIYGDAEYAETMIQVQAYWHEHVYSSAVEVMEAMVAEDPEIGSIKELGSLYERVGKYDSSLQMRRRELAMVRSNPQAAISTLLEIVQLHMQEKDDDKALAVLGEMETLMLDWIRKDDAQEFFKTMTFRSYWAMHLSRLGESARAWKLIRYDVGMTKRQIGRMAEPVLRTLVVMYDKMCMARDAGKRFSSVEEQAMKEMKRELDEAFGRGYFKPDDSYNAIIGRYFLLGRYAVSDAGLDTGITRLRQDGPYPEGTKDHTRRSSGPMDEDWRWFRIAPQLFLVLGLEKLDRDEYPELYNPQEAKLLLEDVARAVRNGTGLGSDVAGGDDVIKAEMTLAFLNRDLDAFRRCLTTVKEKDYSSLYDEIAMTFGLQCGFIPLPEFPAWAEVFREFFPGTQHYFKVVYRAMDKENYDHALLMAEATARFFPDHPLLLKEAEFVRSIVPDLKMRKLTRPVKRAA